MRTAVRIGVYGLLGILVLSGLTVATAPLSNSGVNGGSSAADAGCPYFYNVHNVSVSPLVGASMMQNGSTWSYYFDSFVDLNSSAGVPGLIEYCVYTSPLPGKVSPVAIGADGSSFTGVIASPQGYFGFHRATDNRSNIGLDGQSDVFMGTATWATGGVPGNQTILLHINDPAACRALYGGWITRCFVYPGTPSNQAPCAGNPVCKTVSIPEATSTNPLTVPSGTLLHIDYTYTISNAATNSFNMEFLAPSGAGATTTGVKDTFTCEQILDPNGTPGAYGYTTNYSGTGLDLRISQNGDPTCDRTFFTLASASGTVILTPGQSITFTIDMTTTAHGFTGSGIYCINAGVSVVWWQSNDWLYHYYHSPMVDVVVS